MPAVIHQPNSCFTCRYASLRAFYPDFANLEAILELRPSIQLLNETSPHHHLPNVRIFATFLSCLCPSPSTYPNQSFHSSYFNPEASPPRSYQQRPASVRKQIMLQTSRFCTPISAAGTAFLPNYASSSSVCLTFLLCGLSPVYRQRAGRFASGFSSKRCVSPTS